VAVSRVCVFGDEGGDLTFERPRPGVTRYFTIGTITVRDCSVGDELLALRRELAWNGLQLDKFHATSDKQRVRDRVFDVLSQADFRFDATVLDKAKTYSHIAANPIYFYKLAWHQHFKYVAPRIVEPLDELLVVASSLQINNKKKAIHHAVRDVVGQVSPTAVFHTAFSPAISDPCLQAADYMTWAVQRKYELGDTRSYDLVKHKIKSEFQPFQATSKLCYPITTTPGAQAA
jgi:hypothetical protein